MNMPDITALEIKGPFGKIHLYNLYNDGNHNDTLSTLKQHFTSEYTREDDIPTAGILLMGDFNRHHPMWDEARNEHLFTAANLNVAQPLLELLSSYDFVMALPEDIPTLEANSTGNHTHPDNVFCTSHPAETITICNVIPELRPTRTDHYPIITELALEPENTNPSPKRNFRATNWEAFIKHLSGKLEALPEPSDQITTSEQLEWKLTEVNDAIQSTIESCIPMSKPSPYMKRWWNLELDKQIKQVQYLTRTVFDKRQQRYHPIHAELKTARDTLSTSIQAAKEDHWTEYLKNVDSNNIWDIYKYLTNEPSDQFISHIPNLRTNTSSLPPNEQTN